MKFNHHNKKCVQAINRDSNEASYYNSLYAVNQHLGISAGIVKMVCEKINNVKTGVSKKDAYSYSFEYVKKEDFSDNCVKCVRTKMSVEEKKKSERRTE